MCYGGRVGDPGISLSWEDREASLRSNVSLKELMQCTRLWGWSREKDAETGGWSRGPGDHWENTGHEPMPTSLARSASCGSGRVLLGSSTSSQSTSAHPEFSSLCCWGRRVERGRPGPTEQRFRASLLFLRGAIYFLNFLFCIRV